MNNHLSVKTYAETNLPTQFGEFRVIVFHNNLDDKEHIAIIKGDITHSADLPVRLHSECLTSEVLGSLKCDCREQLHTSLRYIARQGKGMVVYLRQEGRGIGLGNKIRAYALQEQGLDTVEANHKLGFQDDLRDYRVAAEILKHLNIKSVKLITNNPKKINGLESSGIMVTGRIPIEIDPNPFNEFYLFTKAKKSGHLLHVDMEEPVMNLTS